MPWNRHFSLQLPDPWLPVENSTSLITDSAYRNINVIICRDARATRRTRRGALGHSEIFPINTRRFVLETRKRVSTRLCSSTARCVILCEDLSFGLREESITPMHTGKTEAETVGRRNAHETIYPRAAKAKHRTVVPEKQINFFFFFFFEKIDCPKHFSRYKTTQ